MIKEPIVQQILFVFCSVRESKIDMYAKRLGMYHQLISLMGGGRKGPVWRKGPVCDGVEMLGWRGGARWFTQQGPV